MADYIERKAAFNMMFSRANPYGGQEKVNPAEIWNQAATIIRTMPAANVREDVQGEWLNFYGDFSVAECSECSECAECYEVSPDDEPTEEFFETFKLFYNFCPNCGARMKGGGGR